MVPLNQFIVNDPLLATNQVAASIDEQIQSLIQQKQILSDRQRQYRQSMQQTQQGPQPVQQNTVSLWTSIDSEIEPLTNEQREMLATNEEYVNNYNTLQAMVQQELLNLVRDKIEQSEDGNKLLTAQLSLVKKLKTTIVETTNREMEIFKMFRQASAADPKLTYDEFIKTMK